MTGLKDQIAEWRVRARENGEPQPNIYRPDECDYHVDWYEAVKPLQDDLAKACDALEASQKETKFWADAAGNANRSRDLFEEQLAIAVNRIAVLEEALRDVLKWTRETMTYQRAREALKGDAK